MNFWCVYFLLWAVLFLAFFAGYFLGKNNCWLIVWDKETGMAYRLWPGKPKGQRFRDVVNESSPQDDQMPSQKRGIAGQRAGVS